LKFSFEGTPTKNETVNTTPIKKYQFGKAFANVVLFPFRLARWIVVNTLRLVAILLCICILAGAVRSAMPMNLPEARGMTYFQFISQR